MEFCAGGMLTDAVKNMIKPQLLQRWLTDILTGLAFIHAENVVHRDIKCDNILLSHPDFEQTTLKIADVGLFKQLIENVTRKEEVSHTKGTSLFMSPEMIQAYSKNVNIGRRTDIWSLGCVAIQMITGKVPQFSKAFIGAPSRLNTKAVMKFVSDGGQPDIPDGLPDSLSLFIQDCLMANPEQRPPAAKLLKHEYLTSDISNWQLPSREHMDQPYNNNVHIHSSVGSSSNSSYQSAP